MIKVIYNSDYKNLKITGHADYADYGKDIVCASVSSIISTSVNLAHEFNQDIKYTDDNSKIEIINNTNDENVKIVLENMVNMLKDLERQYPKNIKISKGEWICYL